MFNLGPLELVAIFVVALLVFGPDKLPEMGKQVGRAVKEFRKFQTTMQDHARDVIEPITGPMVSNGPVGPAPTNIRGSNIPRSASIQDPETPEGEATSYPGAFGHYGAAESSETAAPAAGPTPPPADGAAPAGDSTPPASSPDPDAR
jgi:TatA/E family protein of Tat protein translocase